MSSAAAARLVPAPAGTVPERRVSEQEYWERWYEAETAYEWNNGRLEEKPVSDYLTYVVYSWLVKLLDHFLDVHPVARMTGLDMGFRMRLPDKTVIRKPDLGVVRNDNPVALQPLDRSFHGIFDLCIEALSDSKPGEAERDTVTKKAEYLAAGVTEYYIVHREEAQCGFFFRGEGGVYEPIPVRDGVLHSRVLPGFRFRPGDLIAGPDTEQMLTDEVYRGFVLPAWQQDRQRIGVLESRADTAEAEVARLKSLLEDKTR
jgi:Uma2 family endonuclease